MAINELVIKQISQFQDNLPETSIVIAIDMNAAARLTESRKNPLKRSYITLQTGNHFVLLHKQIT